MATSELVSIDKPQQFDLDKCVHCGLCLNACPTYRELGVEMDSPRGRVYQMNLVAAGQPISESYLEHIDLCLACRACESACPSGVQYGRLVEDARAEIEAKVPKPWHIRLLRGFVFQKLLPSPFLLRVVALKLWLYERTGLASLVRATGLLKSMGLAEVESLSPPIELPTFFAKYGEVFKAEGPKRFKVAMLGGCIANVSFARLNEATVRVLQKNGCEVHVPEDQTCCGALQLHAGVREVTRDLARKNIDALVDGGYDAIITNAAGCGSTLKEYDHLLHHEPAYKDKAARFVTLVKDVNEFLAGIELNPAMRPVNMTVTYQDSCHLAHGQKIKAAPRKLLRAVPGLTFREMPYSDLCCGSAGIYNVVHNDMAMQILEKKMTWANSTKAEVICSANPGCLLQLRAGVKRHGTGQRVMHVVEILDEAYRIS